MRFQSILATTASILSLTSGRLIGVNVPATIKPGDTFTAVLRTENYIQSVYDVAVAFGVAPSAAYGGYIGTVVGSEYLGPNLSNQLEDVNVTLVMPSSVSKGQQIFSAALYSLYGASSGPTISEFNVTVTIGDETSSEYVDSDNYDSISF